MRDANDREDAKPLPAIIELDHVFEALAHPRRRYLLYTLLESDQWSLRNLARQVTAWETGVAAETVTEEEVDRTYVSLYHNHVPKLVEDDIVAFDGVDETIQPGPNAEQVLAVLENVGGVSDSRQEDHARRRHDEGFI